MDARRGDDIATVAAHVDAAGDLPDTVADLHVAPDLAQQMITAPAGMARGCRGGQIAVRVPPLLPPFGRVDIEGDQPGAGNHPHIVAGVPPPPFPDLRWVPGRHQVAGLMQRLFRAWPKGKDQPAQADVGQRRGAQRGLHIDWDHWRDVQLWGGHLKPPGGAARPLAAWAGPAPPLAVPGSPV